MGESSDPPKSFEDILDGANPSPEDIGSGPFSEGAFRLLKDKVNEYITQLVYESTKDARRHRSDLVSASNIERASQYLIASSSRKVYKHYGTLGGIFSGGAVSSLLSMANDGNFSTLGTMLAALALALGTFLVTLHIAKDH